MGLNTAALVARSEFLVCIDGDALLDETPRLDDVALDSGPRVGAVTGNPRMRNRSTLLGRMQVGEFSSIVGLIKRAQRTYGRVFTVSGVVAGFRRTALHEVGYWSPDMLTEDIDISWKLQMRHWDVRFEPRALCWILMPETLGGLWQQRLRWATGGVQVCHALHPRPVRLARRRMWPVLLEYVRQRAVGLHDAAPVVLWARRHVRRAAAGVSRADLFSPAGDRRADRHHLPAAGRGQPRDGLALRQGLGRYYFWMIWYPLAYWVLGFLTVVAATPAVLLGRDRGRAVWVSPDRGPHEGRRKLPPPALDARRARRQPPRVRHDDRRRLDALRVPLAAGDHAGRLGARRPHRVGQCGARAGERDVGEMWLMVALIVLLGCALVLWAEQQRKRFSGVERRLRAADASPEQVSVSLGASPRVLAALQVGQVVTVHHDAGGVPVGVEHGALAAVAARVPAQRRSADQVQTAR